MRPTWFWSRRIAMFVLVTAIVLFISFVFHRHVNRLAVRAVVIVIGLVGAAFFARNRG